MKLLRFLKFFVRSFSLRGFLRRLLGRGPDAVDFYYKSPAEKQCLEPVFDALSKHYPCTWVCRKGYADLGRGTAAVLTTHQTGVGHIRKWWHGYRKLFYLPHDLASLRCWQDENLESCDILFCATDAHYAAARERYGETHCVKRIPLPKLDPVRASGAPTLVTDLPYDCTVLYSPSYTLTGEWKQVIEACVDSDLPVNFIFKGYPYRRFDVPEDCFEPIDGYPYFRDTQTVGKLSNIDIFHHFSSRETDEIERYILERNLPQLRFVERTENLIRIFPQVHVLVSDASSSLIEFAEYNPNGAALETGCRRSKEIRPVVSLLEGSRVEFCPVEKLSLRLAELVPTVSHREPAGSTQFGGQVAAEEIRRSIQQT